MDNLQTYIEQNPKLDEFLRDYPLTAWDIISALRKGDIETGDISEVRKAKLDKVSFPVCFNRKYRQISEVLETITRKNKVTREEILKTYLGID